MKCYKEIELQKGNRIKLRVRALTCANCIELVCYNVWNPYNWDLGNKRKRCAI